jgi:nitrite reductase/ring-hydroxylating ferredoxin subunit
MSSINRRGILASGLASLFSLIGSAVFAAQTSQVPTLKPKRVGQILDWRNKRYTAIKSGKKLIWNKGVPIPIPTTPSPQASPTPSPATSVEAKPSTAPAKITEIRIAASSDIAVGQTKMFMNKDKNGRGKPYIITRTSKELVAFDNVCTHSGCGVEVDRDDLICRCHTSYFDNKTGKAISGPANSPLRSYEIKELAGEIYVMDYPW